MLRKKACGITGMPRGDLCMAITPHRGCALRVTIAHSPFEGRRDAPNLQPNERLFLIDERKDVPVLTGSHSLSVQGASA